MKEIGCLWNMQEKKSGHRGHRGGRRTAVDRQPAAGEPPPPPLPRRKHGESPLRLPRRGANTVDTLFGYLLTICVNLG